MKKLLLFTISLIMLMGLISLTAYAESTPTQTMYSEKPTTGTESPYPGKGYSHNTITNTNNVQSIVDIYDIFEACGCSISQAASGYISGNVYTMTTSAVSTVGYKLTFQVWDGYQWVSYYSITDSRYNTYYIEKYYYRSVTPNKYYRVTAEHYATMGGVTYTMYSTSDYIIVN